MIKDDNTNLIIDPSYPLPGAGVLMADKALKEVQGLAVRSQLLKSSSKTKSISEITISNSSDHIAMH